MSNFFVLLNIKVKGFLFYCEFGGEEDDDY